MPKATHHNAIARLFELLKLLPSSGAGKTAKELCESLEAEGFAVSKRTVERDLAELSRLFGLESNEKGQPHGWRWAQGQRVSFPALTLSQAMSLRLLEEQIRPLMPQAILETLEVLFAEARQKLEALAEHNRNARWVDKVCTVPPALPLLAPQVREEVLAALHDALLHDFQIEVQYQKPGGEVPASLRLHPLGLVQRGPVTYLVATAFDYDDPRLYATHRISEALPMRMQLKRPKGFSLEAFVREGRMQFGKGGRLKLEALVSTQLAAYLEETPLSTDQSIVSRGERRKLIATVPDTWQLSWWILSQGPSIEVLKPVRLRKAVAEALRSAAARYAED